MLLQETPTEEGAKMRLDSGRRQPERTFLSAYKQWNFEFDLSALRNHAPIFRTGEVWKKIKDIVRVSKELKATEQTKVWPIWCVCQQGLVVNG
jgi:hypothetical protein